MLNSLNFLKFGTVFVGNKTLHFLLFHVKIYIEKLLFHVQQNVSRETIFCTLTLVKNL